MRFRSVTMLQRLDAVFFFQAEDGIRDLYVTGVQTCALPISPEGFKLNTAMVSASSLKPSGASFAQSPNPTHWSRSITIRSEERRVGKECRPRRWRERLTTKEVEVPSTEAGTSRCRCHNSARP